jgi:hypothetical protein
MFVSNINVGKDELRLRGGGIRIRLPSGVSWKVSLFIWTGNVSSLLTTSGPGTLIIRLLVKHIGCKLLYYESLV